METKKCYKNYWAFDMNDCNVNSLSFDMLRATGMRHIGHCA